jgi:hypothetical protein
MERKSLQALKLKAELTVLVSDKGNVTVILDTMDCGLRLLKLNKDLTEITFRHNGYNGWQIHRALNPPVTVAFPMMILTWSLSYLVWGPRSTVLAGCCPGTKSPASCSQSSTI